MYRVKLIANACAQDDRITQFILAKHLVNIIRSYIFFWVIYIIEIEENKINPLLADLNKETTYGVRLVSKKKVKEGK